jgi:hypothetical protein
MFKFVDLLTPEGITEKVAFTPQLLSSNLEAYQALSIEIDVLNLKVFKFCSIEHKTS